MASIVDPPSDGKTDALTTLYGECRVCRLYFAIKKNGQLRHHKGRTLRDDGYYDHCCAGEGQEPLRIWAATR